MLPYMRCLALPRCHAVVSYHEHARLHGKKKNHFNNPTTPCTPRPRKSDAWERDQISSRVDRKIHSLPENKCIVILVSSTQINAAIT